MAAAAREQGQARPCVIAASHPVEPGEIGSDLAPLLDRFILLVSMQPLPAERRRELLADYGHGHGRSPSHSDNDGNGRAGAVEEAAGLRIRPADLAELAGRARAVGIPDEVGRLLLGLARAIEGSSALAAASSEGGAVLPGGAGGGASLWKLAGVIKPHVPPDPSAAAGVDGDEAGGWGQRQQQQSMGLISDRRLVRAARLLRYAAAADGRYETIAAKAPRCTVLDTVIQLRRSAD